MKLYDTFIESVNEKNPSLKGNYSCVLIGGFDDRPGYDDKPISWQVNQLQQSTGINDIKGFRYNAPTTELCSFFKQNPNVIVFLFSKGCERFNDLMSCKNVNKNRIYIIEPWVGSSGALSNFNEIATKIPAKHIFVGSNSSRGKGINGAVSSNGKTHWDAIAGVGGMFGGLLREQMIGKIFDKVKSFFGASTPKNPTEKPFSVENLKSEIIKQKIKYPNIVLAQAVLESGHFDSDIFLDNNNLFGMKKPSVRKTLATGENRGHATFRNWVDSVIDYKLFQDQNGYSNLSVKDYMKKLGKEYCPGCDYENKIKEQLIYNKKNGIFI
jgi:hypothetical protein